MSKFTQGFSYGFTSGLINRLACGWNVCGWQTPVFFTPVMNFGCFSRYTTPMPDVMPLNFNNNTSLWNFAPPQYEYNFDFGKYDWSNVKFEMPNYRFGDTFTLSDSNNKGKTPKAGSGTVKHWSEMTDSELRSVYGDYTRNITTPYSGTAEDLNKYLEGKGVLAGKGEAFLKAQKDYGISASVLVAICMNESGQGTSDIAKNKNNVGGVRISGKTEFRSFDSVEDCISEMARFLKAGYVDNKGRSLTALYQVNAKYCPASDPTDSSGTNGLWARNVDKYAKEVEAVKA